MSIETKADEVLATAKQAASHFETWADFSVVMFDQESGVVAKAFPNEAERQSFFDSRQYEEINQIVLGLMKKTGLRKGSTPTVLEKSGRFNVRIPKTLHQSLEIEAKREKVSLNQLAVTKLSIPLRSSLGDSKSLLVRAFADVHDGFAIDRIIVDPDYNQKFLRRCRELGLTQPDRELNHVLMNIRKSKKQCQKAGIVIPETTRVTEFRDFDEYQFAAEIAVRLLQRSEGVYLDRILCDPDLSDQFDKIAQGLVNQTRLKLRWAAFNLRKTRRLRPISDLTSEYDLVSNGPFPSVDLDSLPNDPGVYAIYDGGRPVFAGETERLRHRLSVHRQYGIPFVDVASEQGVILKTFVAPSARQSDREKWLMAFINAERPLLNFQQDAA